MAACGRSPSSSQLLVAAIFYIATVFVSDGSPLFRYGVAVNDKVLDHQVPVEILDLPHPMKFYGNVYHKAYVTPNGFLSLINTIYEPGVKWGTRHLGNDPPFLAPLYFSSSYLHDLPDASEKIYYRQILTRDADIDRLSKYIQVAVVGAGTFQAQSAVYVTWENLIHTYLKTQVLTPNMTNTFQLVLIANSEETYAIFNYDNIAPLQDEYTQAGINAGNNKAWESVLPEEESITQLPHILGSNVTGRYIFRVSGDVVTRGGCLPESLATKLSVHPSYAGMFGGAMIDISGPCLNKKMLIKCKFGDTAVSSGYIVNSMRARCPVPHLFERDLVKLSLSVDGGISYKAVVNFTIVMQSQLPQEVKLPSEDTSGNWYATDASIFTVEWSPDRLSYDPEALVEVNLIGYRENKYEYAMQQLVTFAQNVNNSEGRIQFQLKHPCFGQMCEEFEVGIVEVKLKNITTATHFSFVTSDIVPLGWFVSSHMKNHYGNNWPAKQCMHWVARDNQDSVHWLSQLDPCPCTLTQVISDYGRWQESAECSIFRPNSKCSYHKTAVHCVRSAYPTISGAGNQCCYRKDGNLLYSSDSNYGSTPDRSHAYGQYPYKNIYHIPEMSHWVHDVISFYYCCLWTSDHCQHYMDLRPTKNCRLYKPPKSAVLFGDPHVVTLDGLNFTFQAVGTYWLLRGKGFKLQGEFEQSNHVIQANCNGCSVLKAIALSELDGHHIDKVEVQLRRGNADPARDLDVLVNGHYQYFDRPALSIQQFHGVRIQNLESENRKQSNLSIVTNSGFGLRLVANNGLLQLIIAVSPDQKDHISGLLGTWDDNAKNDLEPSNWLSNIHNNSINIIHHFDVSEGESLFKQYVAPSSKFLPTSIDNLTLPPDSDTVCGSDPLNHLCVYDYIVTGNRSIAYASRRTIVFYLYLNKSQQIVKNCGNLPVKHVIKDSINYSLGETVTVKSCHEGFVLKGARKYTCKEVSKDDYRWQPEITAHCITIEVEMTNTGLIVGVVIGVIVVIAILITVGVCLMKRRKEAKSQKKCPVSDAAEGEAMMTINDSTMNDKEKPEDGTKQ